ncbi:hypothetical protein GCM10007933_09660 [Zoogloea oryzae]|uniref:Uncharacterized protein n=1 Tax=Zoogloea oryzae TaxID=310767 RepID=A0ABQ6F9B0_9RHOO|nr:hypothetical protein GCM10007933_09660 [Zoogloea oryzae]
MIEPILHQGKIKLKWVGGIRLSHPEPHLMLGAPEQRGGIRRARASGAQRTLSALPILSTGAGLSGTVRSCAPEAAKCLQLRLVSQGWNGVRTIGYDGVWRCDLGPACRECSAAPVQGRQSACAPARNWYKFIVE